jgi:ABC-2 type transport system ATP-binding protein
MGQDMSSNIIEVTDLRYTYQKGTSSGPALDGLSFTVARGEVFGLLGPNGAGKSTAVKILTTILRPTSGRALVNGFDAARQPLEVRRQLAAVLQENAVETMLQVWDNLLLYGRLHGYSTAETRRRSEPVIELLELGAHLTQRAHALSGGFKRRLQLAKALMVDTPILFLDEATTGMDPLIKRKAMEAIRRQARAGRTVFLTTQLLDEAESLCDHMLLMNRGRQMAGGKLSELRLLSRKMFTIQLGFAAGDGAAVEALRALGPKSLQERDGEVQMDVEGSENQWIQAIARISERWPLEHFEIRGANLERIFFELYGEKVEEATP